MTGDPEQYDAQQARTYTQKVLDSYKRALLNQILIAAKGYITVFF